MKKRRFSAGAKLKKLVPGDVAVGVGWYTPQDWAVIKANALDPERFEDSFAEWEKMANDSFANIRKSLPGAVKTLVSADALLAWCLVEGRINDAAARSEFVRLLVS